MENTTRNHHSARVGIFQFDVQCGKPSENVEHVIASLEFFSDCQTDLVVLPEMWLCGFDNISLREHANTSKQALNTIITYARQFKLMIAGSLPEIENQKIFNTFYVIDKDGSIQGKYRKIHLFSPTDEPRYFSAGNEVVVCETSIGKIGLMICYDLRFPELCRKLTMMDATIVLVCGQWPKARIHHWDILNCARAIENQLFIVAANRCGKDNDLIFGGHSQLISPTGDILAKADDTEQCLSAVLDFKLIHQFRKAIPCLQERVKLLDST
ncbi:MAG: carbon-nitrogen family hydrolase [Desulfobacterales bacterium]|nr:carbon-nitrogen family hydrolase [Desulfobacterales bacterium]